MAEYSVIGTSLAKVDAPERVTGKAAYGADLDLPGMLWAKLVRSPHAHARIKKIDTSKAKALPGVKAVITASDLPHLPKGATAPLVGEVSALLALGSGHAGLRPPDRCGTTYR